MGETLVSIGTASAATGVPAWRLRAWESGGLLQPARSPSGYRLYSPSDIDRIVQLRAAAAGSNRLGLFTSAGCAEATGTGPTVTRPVDTEPIERLPDLPVRSQLSRDTESRSLRILRRFAHAMRHAGEVNDVFVAALDSALALVDADVGALAYADMSTQRYVLAASRGLSDRYLRGIDPWSLHQGLAGQAFGLREPLTIRDLSGVPEVASAVREEGLKGFMCVPLLSSQRRLGILEVFDKAPRLFSVEDVESLELIAASAGAVVASFMQGQELGYLKRERASVLRQWTGQALAAADNERAVVVRTLQAEAVRFDAVEDEEMSPQTIANRLRAMAEEVKHADRGWVDMVPLVREQIIDGWSAQTGKEVRLDVGDWPQALPLELTTRIYLLLHGLVGGAVRAAESIVDLRMDGDGESLWVDLFDDRDGASGADARSALDAETIAAARRLGGSVSSVESHGHRGGVRVSLPLSMVSPQRHALTPRERRVLELLGTGASNRLIAADLGVSPKTLQNHLTAIYRKLGVTNRAQAVRTFL